MNNITGINQNSNQIEELQSGYYTAFIDADRNTNLAFKPEFVKNSYRDGQKVISVLEEELSSCDSFAISVAFVTKSGITPLLQLLQELEIKRIPGRILTTDYLMFSEPEALKTLSGLSNITLRMYQSDEGAGFHTKGYIFQTDGLYRILIGSANMTQYAMTVNQEWNAKIISTKQGEFAQKVCSCRNLSQVAFAVNSNLEIIENEAFQKCTNLDSFPIPASVTEIGQSAFSFTNLQSITLPERLSNINVSLFSDCSNLEEVTIPLKVKNVADFAFKNCNKLSTIHYGGSKSQWAAIAGNGKPSVANMVFGKYDVIFTDGHGNTLKKEVVESGGKATAPETPTIEGYTFIGWDKNYKASKWKTVTFKIIVQ